MADLSLLRAVAVLELDGGAALQVRVADVDDRRRLLEFARPCSWYLADDPEPAAAATVIPNLDDRWLVVEGELVAEAPADDIAFECSGDELDVLEQLLDGPGVVDQALTVEVEALAARDIIVPAADGEWSLNDRYAEVLARCGEASPLVTVRTHAADDETEIRLCGGSPLSVEIEQVGERVRFVGFPIEDFGARLLDVTGLAGQRLRADGDDSPEDSRLVTCAILATDADGDLAGGYCGWFDLGASGVMLVDEGDERGVERIVRTATPDEIADELLSYLPEDLRGDEDGRQRDNHHD